MTSVAKVCYSKILQINVLFTFVRGGRGIPDNVLRNLPIAWRIPVVQAWESAAASVLRTLQICAQRRDFIQCYTIKTDTVIHIVIFFFLSWLVFLPLQGAPQHLVVVFILLSLCFGCVHWPIAQRCVSAGSFPEPSMNRPIG